MYRKYKPRKMEDGRWYVEDPRAKKYIRTVSYETWEDCEAACLEEQARDAMNVVWEIQNKLDDMGRLDQSDPMGFLA